MYRESRSPHLTDADPEGLIDAHIAGSDTVSEACCPDPLCSAASGIETG